jgi:hypothetical protein
MMYKNKYLKYKSKYLQLLKQLGGECATEEQKKDIDPITDRPLTNYKAEHRITIENKCWMIKSAFLYYILQNNPKISSTDIDVSIENKSKIKNEFRSNFFKLYFYTPLDSRKEILAVEINDLSIIPFDDFYQEININENIQKRLREVDEWTKGVVKTMLAQGSLVIIRNLKSLTKINNSLGIIVKVLEGDKYEILLLYPDEIINFFRQSHPDTEPFKEEKVKYKSKHGIDTFGIKKKVVLIQNKINLELV